MPDHVFISYSKRDEPAARELGSILEHEGLECWIAARDIPPGAEFEVSILEAIDRSLAIVVLLSADANASQFVKVEVNRAFTAGKPIFVLRMEDVEPVNALGFYLYRHQWTDGFPPPIAERVRRMARALRELAVAEPGAPEPSHPDVEPSVPGFAEARARMEGYALAFDDVCHVKWDAEAQRFDILLNGSTDWPPEKPSDQAKFAELAKPFHVYVWSWD